MEHELKTLPEYFQAVKRGEKPFELRIDDRPYAVGDTLLLREWEKAQADTYFLQHAGNFLRGDEVWADAEAAAYTGDQLRVLVTYVLRGGPWLAPGYVAMGIRPTDDAVERFRILFLEKLAAEYPDHPWLKKEETHVG